MLPVLTDPMPMEAVLAVLTWAPRLKVAPPPVMPKVLRVPVTFAATLSVKSTSSRSPKTALTFRPSEMAVVPLTVSVALLPKLLVEELPARFLVLKAVALLDLTLTNWLLP